NEFLSFGGADMHQHAGVALFIAADDHDVVAGFDMKIIHSLNTSLQRFRSQAQDLGVAGITQLAGHRSKDTGALGALVSHDDDGGVLIKTDVGPVVAAHAVRAAPDASLHHVALFHGAAGGCLLDRADHDVANICISLAGTAQHAEAHQLFGTGVVGNFEISLHLNHIRLLLSNCSKQRLLEKAYFAFSTIRTRRQRTSLLRGRHSMISTRSPMPHSFFSSRALNLAVRFRIFLYRGCCTLSLTA